MTPNFTANYFFPNLFTNTEYANLWLAQFEPDDFPPSFGNNREAILLRLLKKYYQGSKGALNRDILLIELESFRELNESEFKGALEFINNLTLPSPDCDKDWLQAKTTDFYRSMATRRILKAAIAIEDSPDKNKHEKVTKLLEEYREVIAFNPREKDEKKIKSLREIAETYEPPEYLIDPMFRRGFVYGMTGHGGSGKTLIAALIAHHVARGLPFCGMNIQKPGRVVYLAGENPDDVKERFFGINETDLDVDIGIVTGISRNDIEAAIGELTEDGKEVSLLIVDTLSAYFDGKDENDNAEAQTFTNWLRSISDRVPGNPAMLICCHPAKGAQGEEDLIPRGATAFYNSFDSHLTLEKKGDFCELSRHPLKYRGADFAPMYFRRETVRPSMLKGISTVVAKHVDEIQAKHEIDKSHEDGLKVLNLILERPELKTAAHADIAELLMWLTPKGDPNKKRVSRAIVALRDLKLATGGTGQGSTRTPLEPTEAGYGVAPSAPLQNRDRKPGHLI